MELPKRKNTRLKGYDYNTPGYYFVTLCTKEKQKVLCDIVGTGVLDGPKTRYTAYGEIARKQLKKMCDFYEDIKVDKYVIMPNHIHMIIRILKYNRETAANSFPANARLSVFIGTYKRMCNRECGENIWQYRSHDHIIRGEKDYLEIWQYIDNNPAKWAEDCFCVE